MIEMNSRIRRTNVSIRRGKVVEGHAALIVPQSRQRIYRVHTLKFQGTSKRGVTSLEIETISLSLLAYWEIKQTETKKPLGWSIESKTLNRKGER